MLHIRVEKDNESYLEAFSFPKNRNEISAKLWPVNERNCITDNQFYLILYSTYFKFASNFFH